MKKIILAGGVTVNPARNDLSQAADGGSVRQLAPLLEHELDEAGLSTGYRVHSVFTQTADPHSSIESAEDVAEWVDEIISDPDVRVLVFDLATADGEQLTGNDPTELLIGRVRRVRKDIFVVGFSVTQGTTPDRQYARALALLKTNSLNLVLAHDARTGHHLIAAPEETRYSPTNVRTTALAFLARMTVSRMQNRFTRSKVVPGDAVAWSSNAVPANLREVVDHCIREGAYKPVLGKTAGHFAVKAGAGELLTSIRKSNFNQLDQVGLVRIESRNDDEVIAHGFRPSVGGQSQRIVFNEHPDLECIVHFHCPLKVDAPLQAEIPVKPQWPNECGSHECGRNTSRGLRAFDLGDGDTLSVVFLDDHGPNIVFARSTPAAKVRAFIDANFDLRAKTGGLAATMAH
ncbi:hypothetical protein G3A43_08830 [Paraburkholderia aspalathi]|nr:hypothetical protein [Paraburkholderia aspalathi]MBK3780362.1 hypothetical protein [Paraburkholderia aspalathi]